MTNKCGECFGYCSYHESNWKSNCKVWHACCGIGACCPNILSCLLWSPSSTLSSIVTYTLLGLNSCFVCPMLCYQIGCMLRHCATNAGFREFVSSFDVGYDKFISHEKICFVKSKKCCAQFYKTCCRPICSSFSQCEQCCLNSFIPCCGPRYLLQNDHNVDECDDKQHCGPHYLLQDANKVDECEDKQLLIGMDYNLPVTREQIQMI